MEAKANQEIRDVMKKYGCTQFRLGKLLHKSENTVYRKLRDEDLPESEKEKILATLNQHFGK